MKILILTQPLCNNYGGLLQAYALQTVLKRMGHDVVTDLKPDRNTSLLRRTAGVIKRAIFKYMLRKKIDSSIFLSFLIMRIFHTIYRPTLRFVKENIATIDLCKNSKRPTQKSAKGYDAIIVGSDQVWRKLYSDVPLHLLDFTQGLNIKRIAYAASFGTDDFSEYPPELIEYTAQLAKQFDAISVREDSGVSLCKKYWNVDAEHLLDPTLLLDPNDYIQLVKNDSQQPSPSQGNLFVYILDRTAEKQQIVNQVASTLHLSAFEILPEDLSFPTHLKQLDKHTWPPVSQWLQSFIDAEFVVTDSFHGTLFSILFNKPFVVIGNEVRGMARFSSALKTFHLENRLITSFNNNRLNEILPNKIDWNTINHLISSKREDSLRFLNKLQSP
jgi:hypothetical protein